MPRDIVTRSEEILDALEVAAANREGKGTTHPRRLPEKQVQKGAVQMSFFQLDDPLLSQVREEIVGLDLNTLTPIDALNKLHNIQRLLTGGKEGNQQP